MIDKWNNFSKFIERNELTNSDLLAVVCANLLNNNKQEKDFKARLMVAGVEFEIKIEMKG